MERDRSQDGALDMAMSQIDKHFGKGSVMRMGEKTPMDVESIPTGALALDLALGVGGLPRGRIVEIFGPESSGKSTLAMHVVAEAQRNGGTCAYIDAEHAMDPVYARAIGVNVDELLIAQPDTGEQALEIADMLIRSGALDVLVVDSVAALTPRAEIEGEMGDSHVGLQARLMSQALRKLTATLNKTDTIAMFINQLREKIGVIYGSPEVTPGGPGAEVLLLGPARHPPHRVHQGRRRGDRQPHPGQGGEEQVRGRRHHGVRPHHRSHAPHRGHRRARARAPRSWPPTSWASSTSGRSRPASTRARPRSSGSTSVTAPPCGPRPTTGSSPTEAGGRRASSRPATLWLVPAGSARFGTEEPVSPDHARMLGYLIGDGYVGGKTPCSFINIQESLQQDAMAIASTLGCDAHRDGIETSFSHRKGEKNGLLALVRWAGIWGHLAPEKRIPPAFFAPDVSADVVGNLLFGLWETDG